MKNKKIKKILLENQEILKEIKLMIQNTQQDIKAIKRRTCDFGLDLSDSGRGKARH